MALPAEVQPVVDFLLTGAKDALGENLLGVYTRGSLALGDFDPETSDVDLLVATHSVVSDEQFELLREMHDRLKLLPNRYAEDLEAAYIDAESLRRFVPGLRHPMITSHSQFRWDVHLHEWLLERWTVREHGQALHGPDPKSLLDTISDDELREAVRLRMQQWGMWARALPDKDKDWILDRPHHCYVIETMCRGLYALEHPGLPSKPRAVAWAMEALPDPWDELIRRSRPWREWRGQEIVRDAATAEEALAFVRWAAAKAEAS